MDTLGTGAGQVDLIFQIGSYRTIQIDFNVDISAWTFQWLLKKNKGDGGASSNNINNVLSLTLNNGISFIVYTDSILLTFSIAQTNIEEGDYVWELRRTDINVPLLNGIATFTYDAPQ
jgi:hypothetical protein